jgi:hypothetical protein
MLSLAVYTRQVRVHDLRQHFAELEVMLERSARERFLSPADAGLLHHYVTAAMLKLSTVALGPRPYEN